MDNPDLATILTLIAALLASATVGCLLGMHLNRSETQRWVRRWGDAVKRERNLSDAYASLDNINRSLSKRIAQYAADEARRMAPLIAANRKRHEEAEARKAA